MEDDVCVSVLWVNDWNRQLIVVILKKKKWNCEIIICQILITACVVAGLIILF